ncbi:MAG: hypothetical protein ACXWI6_07390 [Burkholderiales bacterium]
MNSRTLIAAAVAAACTWPTLATAARDTYSGDAGYWAVSTPSSVDESAPWKAADLPRTRNTQQAAMSSSQSASMFSEVMTPASVSESAPWLATQQLRARSTQLQSASLASPQTPWSPNESAPARFNEDMRVRAQQLASVQQARIAVARIESERLAAIERERLAAIEQEGLAAIERERLANGFETAAVVGITPSDNKAAVESTAGAAADGAANAPAAPGERPAQPDQTAGLVDTRGNRPLSLTMTPEAGPAEASATAATEPGTTGAMAPAAEGTVNDGATISGSAAAPSGTSLSDATGMPTAAVGVTSGEGTSVSAAGPVINERPLQPDTSTATLFPDRPFNAPNAPSSGESTSANAYVTLHESATAATTR